MSMAVDTPVQLMISIPLSPAQTAGDSMFISHVQIEENNVPMPCVQGMDISSAKPPTLQLIAIPYDTNQPADLDL